MKNLIGFIIRYRVAFLFLLLEAVAFSFLVKSNSYHHATFVNSSSEVIGSLYSWKASVQDYFQLKKANEKLAQENARLRELKRNSYTKVSNNLVRINDTLYRQQYEYLKAKVINSSISRQNNYLTLNKGSSDGVEPDMGVVGPNGIVGIVKNVSQNFSTVLPVLNSNFFASVKLKRTNDFGLLEWDGSDPTKANMVDVAKHANVKKGDSIITRGSSTIFPEGIRVGKVSEVETDPSKNYHDITVELSTDFSKLYYVYVIKNIYKKEQKELEERTREDVQ